MPAQRLQQYLDQQGVKYRVITHSPAFTAQDVAEVAHVPGWVMAKVVIMTLDGQMTMIVVPAPKKIHTDTLAQALSAKEVTFLHENDFREKFPDCQVGALPPFGNLYEMPVYIDTELAHQEEIVFSAGSYRELFSLPMKDYLRLVQPKQFAG
ncbi:aminoacyl-tRNA deacylase [Oceanisphaera arctica]|uniref:Deacylase n=1 Tax=Oceanisphaera arctica TaxID=641510 RepID=A0A2P5TM18_9GAMM|nr:YbaK/EbsC family protein [Oceanisphaera arctica]PPL16403.1 deacylase [Oceanisphaera arctica]GHA13879.1 deacylase [Oceanisphaera arctica]